MFIKLLLLLFFTCNTNVLAQEISGPSPPFPNNINVTFTCTSPFGDIFWSIGVFQLSDQIRVDQAQSQFGIIADLPRQMTSTAIVDTSRNNGTRLLCQIVVSLISGINGTDAVNISTYGVPSDPTDFNVVVNASRRGFLLSWIPGFSVTNEMVTYVINVSGVRPSILMSGIEGSSVFVSSSSDMRVCPQYMFTLHAQNAAGISTSLTTQALAPTGLLPLEADDVTLAVSLSSTKPSFNVTFMNVLPCPQFPVTMYSLVLSELMNAFNASNAPPFSISPLSVVTDQAGRVTIMVDSNVLADRVYEVELMATSDVSSTQTTLTLYTTGLQGAFGVVDQLMANFTCVFAGGSTALGCDVLLGDRSLLLRINVSQGQSMAVGVAQISPNTQVEDIVVVEVLATGTLSAIPTQPVIQVLLMPSTASPTADTSGSVTMSASSTDSGSSGSSGLAVQGGLLYAIVGVVAAVILFLLLIIIVVIFIIRTNQRKKRTHELRARNGDELKANYIYGGTEASLNICTSSDFTALGGSSKQQASENPYDTADVVATSNGSKPTAPIPTYATVESARHETLLAGGPAVLNPVYGPGSSISPATSPVPVPTANSKQVPNPIYSEAYASAGKSTAKEGIVVSGLNPVYGGVGSVASSMQSQGDTSPRYTNNNQLSKAAGISPMSPSSSGASSSTPLVPPLYEELKPIKLATAPYQGCPNSPGQGPPSSPRLGPPNSPSQGPPTSGPASPRSPLTTNESYGIFNSESKNSQKP